MLAFLLLVVVIDFLLSLSEIHYIFQIELQLSHRKIYEIRGVCVMLDRDLTTPRRAIGFGQPWKGRGVASANVRRASCCQFRYRLAAE